MGVPARSGRDHLRQPDLCGSGAARFKAFIEMCAGEVWLDRLWLNRLAAGFTVSAGRSGDKLNCLQDLAMFAAQMGMPWVPMRITGGNYSSRGSEADLNRMAGYLGVMAQANIDEPAETAPRESDLVTAELQGHHVATLARQLAVGRASAPQGMSAIIGLAAAGRRHSRSWARAAD